MELSIDNISLQCVDEFHNWSSMSKEIYFGCYPNVNVNKQEELIKVLTKNGFYKRHPFADERLRATKKALKNPLDKFFTEYYISKEFIDDIYHFLNSRYIFSSVYNDFIDLEMTTKTNLKYLHSKSDKIERLCSKINNIYKTEDKTILYYLSLYNNDQSEQFLEGFSKMDVAQSFGGSTETDGEFSAWYKIYHNYLKGISPRHDEIPGLKEWQRIASIDLELKYYLELQVRMEELIKKDYFNSISHLKSYNNLTIQDSNLVNHIVQILKYKTDLEVIEKIFFEHKERDSAFFNNLFKYFFNVVPKLNRFTILDYVSFQSIIRKCYPALKNFTINSNNLSRRIQRSFKDLDPFDEIDEN